MELLKLKSGSILEEKEAYSRIVALDNWIFMSLTAGRDYKTRVMPETAIEQARQAMKNVEGALEAVGSSLADVVRRPKRTSWTTSRLWSWSLPRMRRSVSTT
ncbi:Rid family hydrolase [Mesorhizobium escarrei]|uniref:Uncharacterized protein n=1 Tax=Mesorhizobium escarrei TaxID=666018 RepID=A0ABM9DUE7_9HYPH|nr:Rid family hydrolase [Mesorhizobium escarrei]CAH2400335.1 hypothetical protein MES5069_250101 [Mesorhizobium escarrei]